MGDGDGVIVMVAGVAVWVAQGLDVGVGVCVGVDAATVGILGQGGKGIQGGRVGVGVVVVITATISAEIETEAAGGVSATSETMMIGVWVGVGVGVMVLQGGVGVKSKAVSCPALVVKGKMINPKRISTKTESGFIIYTSCLLNNGRSL